MQQINKSTAESQLEILTPGCWNVRRLESLLRKKNRRLDHGMMETSMSNENLDVFDKDMLIF